ncbi:MAG: hypothetical protein ACTHOO_03480 [Alcanivorax sp.]
MWRALKTFTFWAAVIAAICVVAQLLSVEAQIWFYDVYNGLLIQLILIAILIDSVRFKIFRFLLVFPLVFYGGYYYVYFQEGQLLDEYLSYVDEYNENLNIHFDSNLYALTINHPERFVANYKIDVAYKFSSSPVPRTLAESSRMLDKENCAKYKKLTDNPRIIRIKDVQDASVENGRCIIVLLEFPQKDTFMVNYQPIFGSLDPQYKDVYFDNVERKNVLFQERVPLKSEVKKRYHKFIQDRQSMWSAFLKISNRNNFHSKWYAFYVKKELLSYKDQYFDRMYPYPYVSLGCRYIPIITDLRVAPPPKKKCDIILETKPVHIASGAKLEKLDVIADIISVEKYSENELREFKASEQVLAEIDSIIAMP